MNQPPVVQLTHAQPEWENIQIPFEGDVLQRKALAEKMTTYLLRLKAGAVLAIDAPWGEGKSWFGRHWAAQLRQQDYRVVYIDAFEQDYIGDPFLLIATELAQLIQGEQSRFDSFTQASYETIKTITCFGLPLLPYLMAAAIDPTWLLAAIPAKLYEAIPNNAEIKELTTKLQEQGMETGSEWLKHKFKTYDDEKKTVTVFRQQLKEIAQSEENPIVIFIDELDRCRPDFAVKIIERIKHFFNVENVVFVLLLNREQLQSAIKGIYGSETDAVNYLGKFINFFFNFPKKQLTRLEQSQYYFHEYAKLESKKYGIYINLDIFNVLAMHFKLSLRDIEKAIALYAFSKTVTEEIDWIFLTYAIVIKIKHPDMYNKLITKSPEALDDLYRKIYNLTKERDYETDKKYILEVLLEWYSLIVDKRTPDNFKELLPKLFEIKGRYSFEETKQMLLKHLQNIDISID